MKSTMPTFSPEYRHLSAQFDGGRGIRTLDKKQVLGDAENCAQRRIHDLRDHAARPGKSRSEEHTSELQSLMRISYAVFCLKQKNPCTQLPQTQMYHTEQDS